MGACPFRLPMIVASRLCAQLGSGFWVWVEGLARVWAGVQGPGGLDKQAGMCPFLQRPVTVTSRLHAQLEWSLDNAVHSGPRRRW